MLGVYWHTKLVGLVLPDGAARWVIIIVYRVIEVHDALFAVPVQAIGQLHPIWTQQLHTKAHRLDQLLCQLLCAIAVQPYWAFYAHWPLSESLQSLR